MGLPSPRESRWRILAKRYVPDCKLLSPGRIDIYLRPVEIAETSRPLADTHFTEAGENRCA
jgi:hypothetical protein